MGGPVPGPLSYLGVRAANPGNITVLTVAPTTATSGNIGDQIVNTTDGSVYELVGISGTVYTWVGLGGGASGVDTINANAPVAGNYTLAGTANQISKADTAGTTTFSLPAAITAPGSLTTTTSLSATTTVTAGTGITATTGNIVASTGNITSTLGSVAAATTVTAGTTMTAGTGITATTGNIVASTGNITSTLGSVGAATTVTAGTSITATAGDITATLGNVIINGAAKQLRVHGGAVTDFIGQAVLVNGTVTVANTNIAATDRIFVTRSAKNASTAYGVFITGITPATSFTITAAKTADTTTETADVSTVDYFIVRQV